MSLQHGLAVGCVHDTRNMQAARKTPQRWPSGIASSTWGLCSLIGPNNRNPGIWGSDLGLTTHVRDDSKLTMLFGDTWASPIANCQYPPSPSNDLQATLPLQRPARFQPGPVTTPINQRAQTCDFLEYPLERSDDVASWRRVRLFASPSARSTDAPLDMSGLRTPLTAFSDGERLLALFQRNDPVQCDRQADCPSDMRCTSDPAYRGPWIGECSRFVELVEDAGPDYCRDEGDCVPGASCNPTRKGVCLTARPFDVDTREGPATPPWYRDDSKRGLASTVYVAAAIWPDRPADYATIARFPTHRFQNATGRTVAHFDPEHPENNDYRPGYHTLLLWGRSSFVESGGAQLLPFLLYVRLDDLRGAPGKWAWKAHFFAGYDRDGKPMWSEREDAAKPVYGDHARRVPGKGNALEWSEPEFDQVAQMTVSWVEPLARWVMLYGGDLPAFMVMDPRTGDTRRPTNLQWASGAIHMRSAPHPWGAASLPPSDAQGVRAPGTSSELGWSSAEPILTRQGAAPYLACDEAGPDALPGCVQERSEWRSLALLGSLARGAVSGLPGGFADVASSCIGGEFARAAQEYLSGNPIGRLYAPNIIEEWTQDVTEAAARERGERSAELYWNVSTWNPYQVVLIKSQLTLRELSNTKVSALERYNIPQ